MIDRASERESGPVPVPQTVLAGIHAVRESGLTNMLDRPAVIRIAQEMGFQDCADWIRENRDAYATGIFRGFREEG